MDILLVRHGESVGNVEGRMQGHLDFPLSERGRIQARTLARWLAEHGADWDVAYCSPLARAKETADILTDVAERPAPIVQPALAEIRAGRLEGLTRDDMVLAHPGFLQRPISTLGDFAEYGGESYDDVQARAQAVVARLEREHRADEARVLLVGHGGINFQILKRLICEPIPKVCIVRMGNCSATLVRMRDRRGTYIGEIVWHVPLELIEPRAPDADGTTRIFR